MKARGGHPFGLMQSPKNAKKCQICVVEMAKIWYTLSIIYSINLRGCSPLGTISLGQAVGDHSFLAVNSTSKLSQTGYQEGGSIDFAMNTESRKCRRVNLRYTT